MAVFFRMLASATCMPRVPTLVANTAVCVIQDMVGMVCLAQVGTKRIAARILSLSTEIGKKH